MIINLRYMIVEILVDKRSRSGLISLGFVALFAIISEILPESIYQFGFYVMAHLMLIPSGYYTYKFVKIRQKELGEK